MKKSSVIKICSAVFVFAVILVVIILLQSQSESIPYFEFLKEPKPFVKNIEQRKGKFGASDSQFYYAFETDYNDFCVRASAELHKLNFKPNNSFIYSIQEDPTVDQPNFYGSDWHYSDSRVFVSVTIYRNYKLSEEEKNIQKLLTGSIYAEDCVTVQIHQSNNQNKLITIFKILFNKFYEPAE